MTHTRHLVHGQPSAALQVAWCRCGAVYDLRRETWGPPKHTEGVIRAANWRGDEDEVGE